MRLLERHNSQFIKALQKYLTDNKKFTKQEAVSFIKQHNKREHAHTYLHITSQAKLYRVLVDRPELKKAFKKVPTYPEEYYRDNSFWNMVNDSP